MMMSAHYSRAEACHAIAPDALNGRDINAAMRHRPFFIAGMPWRLFIIYVRLASRPSFRSFLVAASSLSLAEADK